MKPACLPVCLSVSDGTVRPMCCFWRYCSSDVPVPRVCSAAVETATLFFCPSHMTAGDFCTIKLWQIPSYYEAFRKYTVQEVRCSACSDSLLNNAVSSGTYTILGLHGSSFSIYTYITVGLTLEFEASFCLSGTRPQAPTDWLLNYVLYYFVLFLLTVKVDYDK
jgi:hypothetical protein